MRLAIWNTNYFRGFGGAEQAVTNLVNRFSRCGIETFLIANRSARNQTRNEFFEPLHADVRTYQNSFANPWDSADQPLRFVAKLIQYAKAALQTALFLRRARVDIVHLHYVSWDVVFLALCKRLCGYRLVITFRAGEDAIARQVWLSQLKIRIALKSADRVSAVSKELCATIERRHAFANVLYIPNATDAARIRRSAAPCPAVQPGHFLFCGRFAAQKRLDVLLEAFRQCIARGCRRDLYLVGNGEEMERVKAWIASHDLTQRIFVVGALSHVQTLGAIRQSRCLLLTSSFEGIPQVVMEAMALSKPVIVPDVGGLREVVAHGESGYVFPADRPELLCEWIMRLAENESAAADLGARGFEILSSKFDLDRVVEMYRELYRSLQASIRPGSIGATSRAAE